MRFRSRPLICVCLCVLMAPLMADANAALPAGLVLQQVLAVDRVAESTALTPAGDLLSLMLFHREADGRAVLRISFLALEDLGVPSLTAAHAAAGRPTEVRLDIAAPGLSAAAALHQDQGRWLADQDKRPGSPWFSVPGDPDALYLELSHDPAASGQPWPITVTTSAGAAGDRIEAQYPADKAYEANCALVLHGNQGLGYTDVFHGRSDDLDGSRLRRGPAGPRGDRRARQLPPVAARCRPPPSGRHNNGDPARLQRLAGRRASTAGWAGMLTSAYAQHIMPFVHDEMNDWAVNIETQMVDHALRLHADAWPGCPSASG